MDSGARAASVRWPYPEPPRGQCGGSHTARLVGRFEQVDSLVADRRLFRKEPPNVGQARQVDCHRWVHRARHSSRTHAFRYVRSPVRWLESPRAIPNDSKTDTVVWSESGSTL